jgi:agmatinase
VRQASRLLRPYHPALDVLPFETLQVADAGDITCNPFDIQESLAQIEAGVSALYGSSESFVAIGGDHTIALPLLRAVKKQKGARLALLHFDAHLDTFDTYFGAAYTHGTPFRRAFEEGLLVEDRSMHVGIRGPLYSSRDLTDDESFGFRIITAMDFETQTLAEIVDRVRTRIGDAPLYVSIDIDVLDPGAAPGTGTPEAGGLTSRELLGVLRGLRGLSLAAADVVEVAPAYDHAEVTSMAASHVVYELISLLALQRTGPRPGR